ncbi:MAG: ABC transporter substrate-binding protein, partial [Advenella sp.]
ALRAGQIDALSNLDPVISLLDGTGDIFTIADTRTMKDTQAIFGGPMPAGCLYTSQRYIDENPGTVQALTNAMVKADKWIQTAGPDEIMKTVPKNYLLGDPDVYKLALTRSFEGLSPDGRIDPLGAETSLKAQAAYIAGFKAEAIDLSKCWTNDFTDKAANA